MTKLKIRSVSAQGRDYFEVMASITASINTLCEEINNNPEMEIEDIRYEQSIQTHTMQAQCFFVTAFIHCSVTDAGNSAA